MENETVVAAAPEAGLTPEQEALLRKLQAIKGAQVAATPLCNVCGSNLHRTCSPTSTGR